MSKSLKYVTEFEFPADKGYTGSCAKEPAKAYAKGGSCGGYTKGGSCGDNGKMMKAKGGTVIEKATNERYPSKQAMIKRESLETPREQREELVQRQVVKAPQMRKRGEPMIASKDRRPAVRSPEGALNAIAQAQPNVPGRAMMKKGGSTKSAVYEKKVGKVMGEFKAGDLHSNSKTGPDVKNPKQAIAIALSEARNATKKK
jgi:hypothetical protein